MENRLSGGGWGSVKENGGFAGAMWEARGYCRGLGARQDMFGGTGGGWRLCNNLGGTKGSQGALCEVGGHCWY